MAARTILASILCSAALAGASPRSDPTTGRAVFTGATQPNASSITLNPAALGRGTNGEIFVGMTAVLDQLSLELRGADAIDATTTAAGVLVAGVVRAGRYTLGFQAHSPPSELFLEGYEALRYHTLGGYQREYVGTIAGSFRVSRKFYVGAHMAHANTFLQLRFARDTALADGLGPRGIESDCGGGQPCGIANPAADERYDVRVRSPYVGSSNLKVSVGFVAEVYRDVWLGVAYHTPPGFGIQTELTGDVDITRAPRDGGGLVRGGSTVIVQYPASVDAELRARVPYDLEVLVGGRWEDLSRLQAYDVRLYNSTFPGYGIPEWTLRARGLHDVFAAWAGVERVDNGPLQRLRWGARVGFETAALDHDALSPLTPSPGSLTLDAGGQVRLGRTGWAVQLSYGLAYFPPVSVGASRFDPQHQLDCQASDYDYGTPGCAAARDGFAIPTAAGDYGRLQHAARLGVRYELP